MPTHLLPIVGRYRQAPSVGEGSVQMPAVEFTHTSDCGLPSVRSPVPQARRVILEMRSHSAAESLPARLKPRPRLVSAIPEYAILAGSFSTV